MIASRIWRQVAGVAVAALCGLGLATGAGHAQDVDFAGKRIEIILPYAEGGGADTWARFIVRFLPDKLPGKPVMVIRNMPGGGAVVGTNYFHNNAKPDGMTLLGVSSSVYISYVLTPDDDRIQFDPSDYIGILASPLGNLIYALTSTGLNSADDIGKELKERLVTPAQSPNGGDLRTLLTLDMLNLEYDPVFGVTGNDANMGILRGEYNIQRDTAASYLSITESMANKGDAAALFTFGFPDGEGGIGRDPAFPDLPSFVEVYEKVHGKAPSGPDFDAWKTFFAASILTSKGLILPGGTPDNIVAAYDDAMKALVEDPEFQAAAAQELGGYPQLIGDEARAAISQAWTMEDDTRAWIADWLKRRFDTDL